MALRTLTKKGNPILSKKCKDVHDFNENLWTLLDDMRETMVKNNGCGLAGPQVGVVKNVVVLDVNNMKIELINPKITYQSKETEVDVEGCLSVDNISGYVERPHQVTVKALDRYGNEFTLTGEGYLARAICHECDHLQGILFTDKMIKPYVPSKKEK